MISPIHLQKGSNQPAKMPNHYTTQNCAQAVNMNQKNIRESIFQSVSQEAYIKQCIYLWFFILFIIFRAAKIESQLLLH